MPGEPNEEAKPMEKIARGPAGGMHPRLGADTRRHPACAFEGYRGNKIQTRGWNLTAKLRYRNLKIGENENAKSTTIWEIT